MFVDNPIIAKVGKKCQWGGIALVKPHLDKTQKMAYDYSNW